ncbi:TetR/AcrR family transcriptional regulator [Mycolicibacillus parakoreensis]|uniref:TetR/AcrR family transcriptional regulator n=1 Tax=Mycolicibacillus parakoreensis TaxID=1069221 RepID=A0ABY3TZC3_9MYCO|nr:TetR/AcrR family transcriptional regulator [Mycolicibacillus parakoreensis]MCV7314627.1 TetR/AcrR family transcriptional regulator [Mycolicibacillus parakoreensis]ULN53054.1 TetR/AcrR family transcriptional regulator [Mycolicibacillus parakoreensis]HLS00184.1 TetR/AcrR family transcriptional regulator [Mycolicibacillus parakoreensis]
MTRVDAAVHRALDERTRQATDEVERILAAAVTVLERVAPDEPRVGDIVAEAGSSKKAFYRYFAGKDDLLRAVMERGVAIVVSYLRHHLAKEPDPRSQVARWIRGTVAQVSDPHLLSMSRAASTQLTATGPRFVDDEILRPLRDLLTGPVTALGGPDPGRDADTVFTCTLATMRRYLGGTAEPTRADVDHLVAFCLRGLGS